WIPARSSASLAALRRAWRHLSACVSTSFWLIDGSLSSPLGLPTGPRSEEKATSFKKAGPCQRVLDSGPGPFLDQGASSTEGGWPRRRTPSGAWAARHRSRASFPWDLSAPLPDCRRSLVASAP